MVLAWAQTKSKSAATACSNSSTQQQHRLCSKPCSRDSNCCCAQLLVRSTTGVSIARCLQSNPRGFPKLPALFCLTVASVIVLLACYLQPNTARHNFITPAVIGSLPAGLSHVERANLARLAASPAAARLQELPMVGGWVGVGMGWGGGMKSRGMCVGRGGGGGV